MVEILTPEVFLDKASHIPVMDVRSPDEFVQGHIPGAGNIPLFDNRERALIGTLYVQSGREQAMKQGFEIVGKKFPSLIESVGKLAPDREILVHCWRGGMRSESIAWFLEKLGYSVGVLSGGYRAYRKFIRQSFLEPVKIILIGGYTGCGKTELINELSASGLQVLNLEEMANHKGSSFGHLGQGKQPTTEQFENNLYESWNRLNRSIPVYAEHESLKIGDIFLPDTFYQSMISSTMIRISLPHEIRVARLIKEYASFRKEDLAGAFVNIRKEMGAQQCKIALEALERDDFEQVVKIALLYYDKTYDMALNRRPVKTIHDLELESADMKQNALKIAEFVREKGIQ